MKELFLKLIVLFLFILDLNALEIEKVVLDLNLSAGSKAAVQWKRVFKSEKKMKRYKIYSLSDEVKMKLEDYLINHAIDSDQPTVAGGF